MTRVLNDAALALMISVGHRTGLFDAMAALPPSTSTQIAAAAGLQERYVREWLGAMFTGGIVEHHAAGMTYHLPPAHAAALTRSAGADNLALQAQYIAMLGDVEGEVVRCFREGGGVPYSRYRDFQRLMAEESAQMQDALLIDQRLPLVEGLVARLEAGIDAADVGCGSGHAINLLARAFPSSRFVGYDLSPEGVAAARREAEADGLGNAAFEVRDVAAGLPASFDLILTFDAVHDQAAPDRVLLGIAAALRPGGVYLCMDVAASSDVDANRHHPLGPFMYTVSCMHCMTVSLADGGAGLGAMWGEQKASAMLAAAGFSEVEVRHLEGDIFNTFYIARKSP